MVSDGMSIGTIALASMWHEMTQGKPSTWTQLMREPETVKGLMDCRSLSSLVTDSAAASSAWGSGVHVFNRALNTLPDGRELTPLYRLLKDKAKMRTGLVTTTTLTHATPAGFAIAHPVRDEEAKIAEKYLESGVDVFLGGGARFFSEDLRNRFQSAGYKVLTDRAQGFSNEEGSRMLGLYAQGHLPYEIDRLNSFQLRRSVPSLREMTEAAIAALNGGPNGFILQVEGGRVDHAAHGNDLVGLAQDQLAYEDALAYVLEWARNDGETLVVTTSDHGNSCPALIGAGKEYFDSTAGLETLENMNASYETLLPLFNGKGAGEVGELVKSRLGIGLTPEELNLLMGAVSGSSALKPVDQYNLVSSMLTMVLSNHTHVCWSGRQHTNEYTVVNAIGPGSEKFEGLIENVSVFNTILGFRGLQHSNPTMTKEEGLKHHDFTAWAGEIQPHWL